jgi:molybdopterin converting factor small subunit
LVVSLTENATIADLIAYLQTQHPALASKFNSAVPMLSGRAVTPAEPLAEAQEVALLLPAAGGLEKNGEKYSEYEEVFNDTANKTGTTQRHWRRPRNGFCG